MKTMLAIISLPIADVSITGCGAVDGAPALGAFDAPSTTEAAEARKTLQHGRLRDFFGLRNRAEKRP